MMRPHILALVCVAFVATSPTARAAPTERDAMLRVLSMLTGGWIDPTDPANSVTVLGDNGTIGVPVTGTTATVSAMLRRSGDHAWDLLSVTMPDDMAASSGPDQSRQTIIGQQQTRGRLDPTLGTPSELHAALKEVTFAQIQGDVHAVSSIDALTADSRLLPAASGRPDIHATTVSTGYALKISNAKGPVFDLRTPRAQGEASAFGIDPDRFPAFAHALHDARQSPPNHRQGTGRLLETLTAATQRIIGQEKFDTASFTFADGTQGKTGPSQFSMESVAANDRLTVSMGAIITELAVAATAANPLHEFVPHHITARERAIGLPISALATLLRDAEAPGADRDAIRQKALRYLTTSGAKLMLDTLDFDSGPLRVQAMGQLSAAPDGSPTMQLHLRAAGVDALLAQAQNNPPLQQIVPVILMAKGMGHADRDALVWDIAVDHGALTVNGIPLGHPPGLPDGPSPNR